MLNCLAAAAAVSRIRSAAAAVAAVACLRLRLVQILAPAVPPSVRVRPSFLFLLLSQYRQGMKRMSNRLRMREFKQADGKADRQAGWGLMYTHLGNIQINPVILHTHFCTIL